MAFRIALMWSGDREARRNATAGSRLAGMFEACVALGVRAEPAVYADEMTPQEFVDGLAFAVLEHANAGWSALTSIRTASGARTSLFVPELDRLFVAERAGLLGSEAAIRVYRPAS